MKKSKRGRARYGSGSVIEKRPGVWRIRPPRLADGTQAGRTVKGTREDALRELEAWQKQLADGDVEKSARLTMKDVFDHFLRRSKQQQAGTLAWYSSLVRNHIDPVIGRVALRDFRAEHARRVLDRAAKSGLAPRSIAGVRKAMRAAHTWILSDGYEGRAIDWKRVPAPYARKAKNTDDIPTAEEVRRVLDRVRGTDDEAIVSVLIGGGLRRGELLGLRWRDVKLKDGIISIEGSVNREYAEPLAARNGKKNGHTVVARKDRAKNEASESDVHLPQFALDALKGLPQGIGDTLVFSRKDGTPLRPDGFTDSFKRLLKECGVRDGIAVHAFGRHGCASLMASRGASMKQVQVHLRHSSISVTMDLYTHLFPEDRKDAAARLDQILRQELRQAAGSETGTE